MIRANRCFSRYITDAKLKDLHPVMPICNVYAVHIDEMSWEGMYGCPVFVTSERGATFVFLANVRRIFFLQFKYPGSKSVL